MTADIINLRKARKAKAKTAAIKTASDNRVKFGRTKNERQHTAAVLKIDQTRLDGAKRCDANDYDDDDRDPGPQS